VASRIVTISVPESHARRIETIEKESLDVLVHAVVMNWFDDGRRRDIPVKRQGISWNKEVYAAMLKHIGSGGISRFVRDAVYEDLSKYEKDLVVIPDWKLGREKVSSSAKRVAPADRLAVQAPMIFPEQWIERMEARWPGKVSTYIKGVVQMKLEKKLTKQFPVQRGLRQFLDR
jgi:ABC-type Fe3+-hydroxamate transport system substrate-binding protein